VSRKDILQQLQEGMLSCWSSERLNKSLRAALLAGVPVEDVMGALGHGVEKARAEFKQGKRSIPEIIISVDLYREAVRRVSPKARKGRDSPKKVGVVIGVVEGDVHDMGKNLVAGVLEAAGYALFDLGRDVPRDVFLESLVKTGSPLLALSGMMSTTLENMRDVVRWTRKLSPVTGIMVGGAALDRELARSLGADGYAESAAGVPEEARRVLAAMSRRSPRRV